VNSTIHATTTTDSLEPYYSTVTFARHRPRLPREVSGSSQLPVAWKWVSGVYYARYTRIIHSRQCWNLLFFQ